MMKKPPIDTETLLRGAAFRLLLAHGEAILPEALVTATGLRGDRVHALLDQLDSAGRIRRDADGRMIGSAGLSIAPDRHQIELEGRRFWTWCAYDIFGIFGALRASGRAMSPNPANGEMINVDFMGGRPQPTEAVLFRPEADLMTECENVYRDWCPNSNLFRTREMAQTWGGERGLAGRVLGLQDAADLATEEWKSMTVDLAVD
jgi:alkylmercury lyase